ncbi:MAG: lipoyl(octanoyl) transferase [Omnitrophica WOR_2 bacterium RIFCSPLOWO2_12_FULL_51_8]|nr:MAG: lipoyl(octanoyl) transferase [Omnitrophica WOR_2 bacterium RIFCSPLOWO2_12_FULL_51_8]
MRFEVFDLGLVAYKEAWDFQKEIFAKVKSGSIESALILCRHFPVITLGRLADERNILSDSRQLNLRQIEIYRTERGGDISYHGPGQLIAYPVFNLSYLKKDIHWFLRYLERIIITFLSDCGAAAKARPGLTGVWIGDRKIASIGIAIRNWISFHGFSVNISSNDLDNFRLIRPCGMNIEMTCLERETGQLMEMNDLSLCLIQSIPKTLDASALGC